MAIDRNTARRGVGSLKPILGGILLLIVVGIPIMMAISGSREGGQPVEADGTTVTTPPSR